jgi:Na+/H+ antiporter NhaD/arsenite permease-like protein
MMSPITVASAADHPFLFGIPLEFILFGLTLLGIAVFHRRTLLVALIGLGTIALYKILFTGFGHGPGVIGFILHVGDEWVALANLFGLLTGFALLSRHFEKSHLPVVLPRCMPHDWKGGFLLLVMVFVLSSFLDNIAGALVGGAMAHQIFRAKVHPGYLVALVAAANAGGAWSVIGDTTTTMMWISGISPLVLLKAIVPAAIALVIFGIPAAKWQHGYSPILRHSHAHTKIDWGRIAIVGLILALVVGTNIIVETIFPREASRFPFLGVALWAALFVSLFVRRPDWEVLPEAFGGSIFLLALVLCASMIPVQNLPAPTWQTAFGLGFVSAVFDNIPLTALALKQGGYDWGFLAFTIGFGGSMIWFGSSAGVALTNLFPEARSVGQWLRHARFVILAYVIGFFAMLWLSPWQPEPVEKRSPIKVLSEDRR